MYYYYLCAKHYKTDVYHCNRSSKEFLPFDAQGDYKKFKLICLEKHQAEQSVGGWLLGSSTVEAEILSKELKTSNYIVHDKDKPKPVLLPNFQHPR